MILVTTAQNNWDHQWFVNGNPDDSSWSWFEFRLPDDTPSIDDVAIGYLHQGLGTYSLYKDANNKSCLYFVTFEPPGSSNLPYNHELSPPDGATSLAVSRDPYSQYTNLFVAGSDGVKYLDNGKQSVDNFAGSKVGAFSGVQQLIAAQDSYGISLWALCGTDPKNCQLNYSFSSDAKNWSEPLALQENVASVAALRNPGQRANELVTMQGDDSLWHQWQDPATSLWRKSNIPLEALDEVQEFISYTTHLNFTDEQQNPLPRQEVKLTSSQWMDATINGYLHQLGPDTPVTVPTDVMGNVTVIAQTDTISTPIYQVESGDKGLGDANPAANVIAGLGGVQTGADLRVELADGTKLLSDNVSDDTADFAALCISNLTQCLTQLPADGSEAEDPDPNSTGTVWGGTISNGQMQAHDGDPDAVFAVVPPQLCLAMRGAPKYDAVDFVEGVVGDVLKFLQSGIAAVEAFVCSAVKGVVRLAVKVAGDWIYIILKSIGEVLEAINWVLSLVGAVIKKVVQWLGFLFNWDDIVVTHNVFNNMTYQTFEMIEASLDQIKSRIDSAAKGLVDKLDPDSHSGDNLDSKLTFGEMLQQARPTDPQQQAASDFFNNSAGGNFVNYQVLHGGVLQGPAVGAGTGGSDLTDLVENTLLPLFKDIGQEFVDLVNTLSQGIQDGSLTIAEVLRLITNTLATAAIEVVAAAADAVFGALEAVLGAIEGILFGPINIPLLTALYKKATTSNEMTLVGGLSLLAAVPSTIAYKLVKNEAPFANGTGGLDTKSWDEIYSPPSDTDDPEVLVLAAGTSHGDFSEVYNIYSQVGGFADLMCTTLSEILTLVDVFSENEIKIIGLLDCGLTVVDAAATVPVDEHLCQRAADSLVWAVGVGGAALQMITYLMPTSKTAETPVSIPAAGTKGLGVTLAPVGEVVAGGYALVECVVDLLVADVSVFAEMVTDDVGHGDRLSDLIKLFENVGSGCASGANGLAAISGDENPEFTIPFALGASAAQTKASLLGTYRAVEAVYSEHLYQAY